MSTCECDEFCVFESCKGCATDLCCIHQLYEIEHGLCKACHVCKECSEPMRAHCGECKIPLCEAHCYHEFRYSPYLDTVNICQACLACPECQEPYGYDDRCKSTDDICYIYVCKYCAQECDRCEHRFCSKHSHEMWSCDNCNGTYCDQCKKKCSVCKKDICPKSQLDDLHYCCTRCNYVCSDHWIEDEGESTVCRKNFFIELNNATKI